MEVKDNLVDDIPLDFDQQSREKYLLNEIVEPFTYICNSGGKKVRSKVVMGFQYWLKIPEDILAKVQQIGEGLHNASLIIDDVEDQTDIRRGKPAAHVKFGISRALNSGRYAYFTSLQQCLGLENEECIENFSELINDFSEEMSNCHHGQGLDIYWRDNFICPTIEEYTKMISMKTGGLFRLILRTMFPFSKYENKQALINLSNELSILFQIRDDFINLVSEKYWKTRGSKCDDITEGKFSFPMIIAIMDNPKDNRLKDILKLKTTDDKLKDKALTILKEYKAIERTEEELIKLETNCRKIIKSLGGNPYLSKIVEKLSVKHIDAKY